MVVSVVSLGNDFCQVEAPISSFLPVAIPWNQGSFARTEGRTKASESETL